MGRDVVAGLTMASWLRDCAQELRVTAAFSLAQVVDKMRELDTYKVFHLPVHRNIFPTEGAF